MLLILKSSTNKFYICIKNNSFKIFQYTSHVLLVTVVHLHVNRTFGVLILLPYNFSMTLECYTLNASSIFQIIRMIDATTILRKMPISAVT